ncbi:glycoside hydrolase family 5 protein [Roseateles albus]|uniref:Cellulase family glycosylhydrolase n=1 Tax=Roseateles albus TaxID=2987525 RepID=A0ABT5KJ67_9BURK|nr:cellulase family glycosylhydrolase [Roseateles albus]MDC8773432.1 cellulase family glycosylhydrolase [Roseateles albus]
MKFAKRRFLLALACLVGSSGLAFADGGASKHAQAWQNSPGWWNSTEDLPSFDLGASARQLPLVKVQGNKFVNEQGAVVVFRGVNMSDPDKLESQGQLSRAYFEAIQSWGANVVRIPVHPSAWQRRGKKGYLALLDQSVRWINELGMYVIVDWHSIGNLKSELFQNSSYATSKGETFDFFRTVAARYKGVHTVAMYEVFNEPTVFGGRLGVVSWADWKAINEEAITIIQAHNADAISLVAGFNWAYDLSPVAMAPIERKQVAYVSHPYPMKVAAPYEENWQRDWGFVADKYPVIATEIGYQLAGDKGAHIPVIDDGSYGPRITNYLGGKGISWVAWVFDPDWAPQLIKDWRYEPTLQGRHFRAVMLKENKQ